MRYTHPTRTRFLADLDVMLMTDRNGAIEDILQVLRERGVLQTVCAIQTVSCIDRYKAELDDVIDHVQRNLANRICQELLQAKNMKSKELPENGGQDLTIQMSLEIVI